MLLYIHVPFCGRKCAYCAFHSTAYDPEAMDRYVRLVLRDMRARAELVDRRAARTLYFGGGTPSLLEPGQMDALIQAAGKFFGLAGDAEITLEANPESAVRPGFLRDIRRLGVNRISLGVQSLHNGTLRTLGRPHDACLARRAVHAVRDSGFDNLSLDFIWGIPGQTPAMWLDDLAAAADMAPEHLSCYGLTLEEGVSLAHAVERGVMALPDEDTGADMYVRGAEYLAGRGFSQYEVSNFARPERKSRHNRGYWAGEEYLGFGPSAVSTMDSRRWTAPSGLDRYAAFVSGTAGADTEERLSETIARRERIMLALRTREGLDLKTLASAVEPELRTALEPLRSGGRVRLENGRLSLTRTGMLVSNSIIEFVLDLVEGPHTNTGTV